MALLLVLAVLPSVAAEDWPMFRFDETHQGYTGSGNTKLAPFKQSWWNNISVPADVHGSPVVDDGRVFVGAWDGNLYAFDSESGNLLWKNSTGGKISGAPAVSGKTVYAVNEGGTLKAFNAKTGTLERETSVGATFGSPVVHENRVFIGTEAGSVSAYEGGTLTKVWAFSTGGTYFNTTIAAGGIEGTPAVYNGQVIFGARNHYLFSVSEQGTGQDTTSLNWIFKAGGAIRSSPAIDKTNSRALFGAQDGKLYAVPITGTGMIASPAWTKAETAGAGLPSQIQSSPAIAYDKAFVGANNGNIIAVNLATGAGIWTLPTEGQVLSSPAVANNYLVVGSSDRKMYMLHVGNGTVAWSSRASAAIESSPAIADSQAFWADTDGTLYSFGGTKPPRTDLAVESIAASLVAGQSGGMVATIKNVGALDAPATTVQFFNGATLIATATLGALPPGASGEAVGSYAPADSSTFTLRVVVDPTNSIQEVDKSNNQKSVSVTISPAPTSDTATATEETVPAVGPGLILAALAGLGFALRRREKR